MLLKDLNSMMTVGSIFLLLFIPPMQCYCCKITLLVIITL